MTDLICITVMIFVCLIILISFFHSLQQKTSLGRTVSALLFAAQLILLTYTCALFTPNARISSFFYSLYFSCNTAVSVILFDFSLIYTKKKNMSFCISLPLKICITADIISMMLNPWLHHAVTYRFVQKIEFSCWKFIPGPFFSIHLLLCYILLVIFLLNLAVKAVHSPPLYKTQYTVIIGVLAVCTAGNSIFLFSRLDIDMSVLIYGFAGMLIYHFTFISLPRKLTNDMGRLVLNQIKNGLIFFDNEGKCIYTNRYAENWFGKESSEKTLGEFFDLLRFDIRNKNDKQTVCIDTENASTYYRVRCQELEDRKKRYLGSFLVLEDITEEKAGQEQRLYMATHDPLTGIFNKAAFYGETRDLLDRCPETEFCIITSDIRQFKLINDFLGRETGNSVLKSIAKTFMQINSKYAVYGRLENDKFAVCAPQSFHLEEDIPLKLEMLHTLYNSPIGIVNYFGVYKITNRTLAVSVMTDRAAMALNSIKGNATQRVAFYGAELRNELLIENQLTAAFPDALEYGQFKLYYQPQIDSRSNRIVGAEALVRWNHPERGLIPPAQFIPLFEKTDLIFQLDQYVWEEACRQITLLQKKGYDAPVSVNISAKDIYLGNIPAIFSRLLSAYKIPPERLKLEITESAMTLDVEQLKNTVLSLQKEGFQIEMDDFGSGYSSLNTLKDIPVNVLKMDMKFLEDAEDQERSGKILKTVVALAGTLGIPLIAEGVERKDQVDYLSHIGCYNLQGFFFSKPVPFDDFIKLLDTYQTGPLE